MEENEIQIEENQDQQEGYKPLFDEETDFTESELSGSEEEKPKENKPVESESPESKGYVPEAALYEQRQESEKWL